MTRRRAAAVTWLAAAVAIVAFGAPGCRDSSRLSEPKHAPPRPPQRVAISGVESSGFQEPGLIALNVQRGAARVGTLCRPLRGARARVALTIDSAGHITELRVRADDPALAACASKLLRKQRFGRVKGATFATAELEFLE